MVSELQFVAIAAFLTWGLVSSLCGLLKPDPDEASRLVWREHDSTGWSGWREVHYGLTAADRRILLQPERDLDQTAYTGLFDTVMHQTRQPDSDAVQFAIVRRSHDTGEAQNRVVFVSDVHGTVQAARRWRPDQLAVASVSASVEAQATSPSGRMTRAAGAAKD
jgi:hypothetical protein